MVIVMNKNATQAEIENVVATLIDKNFDVHRSTGISRTVIGAIGDKQAFDEREFLVLDGVSEVVRITEPYKLASRTFQQEDTIIKIKDVQIGGDEVVVMAGPCAVESATQIETIAAEVKKAGAKILRGGAFKPRTSPYSFQGLGEEGLQQMRSAADKNDLLVVSEIMDRSQVKIMVKYCDILQVGARNMQNFDLLKSLGKIAKPILLKRGMSATIEETLMSAEYIMSGGNYQVIICERGIRTFEKYTRNTMDISSIPVIQKLSHLPIIADPSHGTGIRNKVAPMARAAVAAGAHGLQIEVHNDPDHAASDGAQSLYPEQFAHLMKECRLIANAIGKKM
ncbi:MAG: 3-deoxy-7-phosphoheptulonate synthase [Calditrichaeota bacterium]|nr:MAG: 3-deoxy-7-phosphoheptulonate synthase [Calditrichota bacterium]